MTNREALIEAQLAHQEAKAELERAEDAYLREHGWVPAGLRGYPKHWKRANGATDQLKHKYNALRATMKADPGGRF